MNQILILIIIVIFIVFVYHKNKNKNKNIESFSNIVTSCRGWNCSDENAYCPPGVPGSGSKGYCCLKNSNGSLRWKSGACPGRFEGTWKNIATPWLRRIVAYGGNVYGIGGGQSIWKRPANNTYLGWGGRHLSSSCCVTNIDAYDGYLYGIGRGGNVWRRSLNNNDGGWTRITNAWVKFIKCYKGRIYGIGGNNYIYYVPISGGDWKLLPSSGGNSCCVTNIDIVDDYIYGVGTNSALYRRKLEGEWKWVTGGSVTQIQVYGGYVYGIGLNNWVYRVPTSGGSWKQLSSSCCVRWITIADGKMFGLGMNYSLWFKQSLKPPYSSNIIKAIGGYDDRPDRALPDYLGNVGTDPSSAAKECSRISREKGYKYFGLQCPTCGGQCFAGNDLSRAIEYGSTNTSGLGGIWKNYIYENLPAAEYIDTSGYCSGDENQKIYINAISNNYSKTNKNREQCKKSCSADGNCQMYLMEGDNTCLLYNDVSNVKMYCDTGSDHAFYGNVKTRNMIDSNNVANLNDVSLPPPTDTYIPQNWGYPMPYTQHCERSRCPYTKNYTTCKMDFNGYSKAHIENWLKWNNVEVMNNPGNENSSGDAWISCKAMGYDATSPDLDKKYKKIGWDDQPFSCQVAPETINPQLKD